MVIKSKQGTTQLSVDDIKARQTTQRYGDENQPQDLQGVEEAVVCCVALSRTSDVPGLKRSKINEI